MCCRSSPCHCSPSLPAPPSPPDTSETSEAEAPATSTSSGEISVPAALFIAKPQDVTCFEVWKCDKICGRFVGGVLVRFGTNVLHEHCSDGTDTVEITHPCGEDCF
jgi:hypothetical protein